MASYRNAAVEAPGKCWGTGRLYGVSGIWAVPEINREGRSIVRRDIAWVVCSRRIVHSSRTVGARMTCRQCMLWIWIVLASSRIAILLSEPGKVTRVIPMELFRIGARLAIWILQRCIEMQAFSILPLRSKLLISQEDSSDFTLCNWSMQIQENSC